MKYRRFFMLFSFCLLTLPVFTQTHLNLSLKAGLLRGKEVIESKNISNYDLGSYEDNANSNISMAFSIPLNMKFRLGAEIGLLSFRTFLDYDFTYQNNLIQHYKGRYRINQAFVALVPEYRPIKWIFLNAGAGYFSDFNSYFTNGERTWRTQAPPKNENLAGLEYKRHNSFGYFIGTGLCPSLTNELALLGEIRYTGSPASISNADQIGIGYGAFNFNIGLMFKFRP